MHFLGTSAISGILASLVLLTSVASAEEQDPVLKDSEAIQAITGSTITIVEDPYGPVAVYVGSDYTYEAVKNGKINSGKWFEKDHLFCAEPEIPCSGIVVSGAMGYLIDYEGIPTSFTIKAGNQVDSSAAK